MDRTTALCSCAEELEMHVLGAADDERARWAAQRQPADLTGRPNWWLHLLLHVQHEIHQRSQARLSWTRLYVWAVGHAADTGAFTRYQSAITMGYFITELRDRELLAEVADALPSPDAIVRACLAEIPFVLNSVPDATDLRLLDIDTIRRSRLAKNLVRAASWHRPHVHDPAVATELDDWIEALPHLV